ncbi:PREDICTED: glutamate--cysteine ligase regulatory subunit-like [Amphimedon queenslandica]|uniref:GCS light chain n=1 Tax=Amphimedon queenslandica TaxID=400682 RepID=A0A1X7UWR1_AMPQE|nr:PREDICTED: glutamate--cysteine ligase regulatory subunit-like [Amphimedon queenslandica]|eukprot:XP_011403973.1 PREDICTED: glutamate--cysteine ligase regulatory subunit-like [Amphimedon queenslandica]
MSGSSSDELFSSRSKVVLNCGNIASWSKIKKKALLTSTGELVSAIENTLISYSGSQKPNPLPDELAVVRSAGLAQTIPPDERENLTITLKVFPSAWDPNEITQAVDTSLVELGINAVDTLILAPPSCQGQDKTMENIQKLWKGVEESAMQKKMSVVGVADLDKKELEELFNWAKVKPRINQVNLAHCCTIPEDLAQYCKEVDIKLFTHNDDRCLLPPESLQETMRNTLKVGENWSCGWVSRYNSIINLRGIVSHKGYLVELNKVSQ